MGINRHQDLHALCFSITIPPGLLFIHQHMVISTIAIIANRDQLSTYMFQVTGNHLSSTGLSKAKHIFNPRPTKDSSWYLENIGGLECSRACLSEMRKVGGQDTQEDLPRWLLLPPKPPAPGLPVAPPDARVRTRVESLLPGNLLHTYAQMSIMNA